jgi:hypothetical protein
MIFSEIVIPVKKNIAVATNCDRLSQLLQPSTPNAGYLTFCAVRSRTAISINVMNKQ